MFGPVLARLKCFPMPTLAVINGHAYAGGLIFACAHDSRIMRGDKAKMCLSEAAMGGAMSNSFTRIILSVMSNQMYTSMQYGRVVKAREAYEEGVVDNLFIKPEDATKLI